jgi:hypothetical protein
MGCASSLQKGKEMYQKRGFWIALWVILVVVTGLRAYGYGGMGYGR